MINWEKIYFNLIYTKNNVGESFHLHHIIPKHWIKPLIWSSNEECMCTVMLSFKYHILAHYILYRWCKSIGDKRAYMKLLNLKYVDTQDPEYRNSPEFNIRKQKIKEKRALQIMKPHSEETKKKMGVSRKGKTYEEMYGVEEANRKKEAIKKARAKQVFCKETIINRSKKMVQTRIKNNSYIVSEEVRKKMSNSAKNRPAITDETRLKLIARNKNRWSKQKQDN